MEDVSQDAVVDAFDGFDVRPLVPALRARCDAQTFLEGILVHLQAGAHAGAVHRHGFLREDVLARGHTGFQMVGAETWRRSQDDVIDIALQHPPISFQATKATLLGDIHAVAVLLYLRVVGKFVQALPQSQCFVAEIIAQRHDPHIRSGPQHILGCSGTATTASDHAHFDLIGAGGVNVRHTG
ncbi:hypothetical protein HRbin36_01585 [bacterium HR36]|nr:hypothetical protein HRbin36_01585 [bacterium HR36]